MQFKKATKKDARLRLALTGISGTGKTMTALQIAQALGGKTAVIDTERGSASKYADLFEFDVLELEKFSPTHYIEAVQAAEDAGYDNLVIDSLSHEWSGAGGILEIHDSKAKETKDSFRAWGSVTPQHNRVLDKILASRCHIIATMRAKSEYSITKDEKGKTSIAKIGLAPVQKDNVEYEFDVVASLDTNNVLTIDKTRCVALAGKQFDKDGKSVAEILANWLKGDGERSTSHATSKELIAVIRSLLSDLNAAGDKPQWVPSTLKEFLDFNYGASSLEEMGYEQLEKLEAFLLDRREGLEKPKAEAA
jgi:hypothetical protein